MGGRMSPGVLGTCATLLVFVQAGPVLRFPRESEDYPNTDFSNYTANEVCFSDQRVFQRGEEVPNAGPCEECRCEPPSIVCQMTKCPVNNNGCRTIQRPNHCCPDYNCECDYNGQLYNDGERIDLPEDPCQVCYCKGGDVMCTSITCYHRDDCEPKQVPGQCCPKYEDCPIRDMEASNTEEKSVQTRSPNKTMNSNPNKEIQPWLLTKSVSQTSSSLALPKLGETTTDSGNIIIVSDWLVEQKTTEDFKTKQTDDPVFNNKEQIGTTQPTKHTQSFENDGTFEIKPETVRPTPIEEVVFTRIDLPKRVQEEIIDMQTTSAPDNFDKKSSNTTKLSETQDLDVALGNSTQTELSNPNSKISKIKSIAVNKTDDGSSSVSSTESNIQENESTKITSYSEILTTQAKKGSMLVELRKNSTVIGTDTPQLLVKEIINNDFEAKHTQNETESTKMPPSTKISNDKDIKSEEITLYHLFGFDKSAESENAKQTPTGKYSGEYSTGLHGEQDIVYTTDPTSVETVFDHSNEYSAKDVSLKDNKPKIIIAHEIGHFENNALTDIENNAKLYDVSTVTENLEENISTATPKASISKLQLQTGKLVLETNRGDEVTTYLPETTTDIGTSAVFDNTILKQLSDEKTDQLSNVIVEKQAEKLDYIETDSTTIRSSGNTNPVITESSQSTTQKFLPENKFNYHDHEVQETTLNSHISKLNDYVHSTATTNNEEETTKYTLSEIEIILDEANDKTVLGKSINSQENVEQDEVVLNLSLDEVSSENKEVILNHPPVLELNSHVPFLQIGGNGNSESSDIEYDQTTEVNKLNYVSSFNKEKIQDDKDTTNLINEHTTSPPLSTITNIFSIASLVENNTRKSNDSSNNASDQIIEEITIPTIAVVPLTPGDLKIIAEYLISEKIKPISKENNNTYFPNQWLKGNLTSDDNIASILSAANVSIGLMNQTNIGRMMEIIKKTNQSKVLDIKYDKETRYKSNSNTLQNKYTVTSKTDNLHDKKSDDHELMKSTSSSLDGIDESIIVSDSGKPGEISNGILKTTEKPFNKIMFRENDYKNTPLISSDGSATERSVFPQIEKSDDLFEIKSELVKIDLQTKIDQKKNLNKDISQNKTSSIENVNNNVTKSTGVSKAEKVLLRGEKANHENTQVISRFSDSGENTTFDTHTTDNVYSKPSPNIPETTSIGAFS